MTYQDKASEFTLKSGELTGVQISGTHARITGIATVNGSETPFTIDVDDLGEPGRSDTFTLTAGAYSAGGVLNGGNIQIHR